MYKTTMNKYQIIIKQHSFHYILSRVTFFFIMDKARTNLPVLKCSEGVRKIAQRLVFLNLPVIYQQ